MREAAFDGSRTAANVPPKKRVSSPSTAGTAMCRRRAAISQEMRQGTSIDPVTFEVVRHALWNVNEEHGATIQRLSGSPVAMYALDLNPVDPHRGRRVRLLRPVHAVHVRRHRHAGEVDAGEPQRQPGHPRRRHVPRQRSVGRRRAPDGRDAALPGVLEGRAVLLGDELPAPVRHRRHHAAAASAPRRATRSTKASCIPPVKIVENNEIRRDIEELYLRSSRKPAAVALDFRAQLAGNMTARDRVLALIRRYGAETVKGVMRKILDDGERAFLKKLARLPDGVWRDRTYVECCRPGDRQAHRVMLDARRNEARSSSSRTKAPPRRPAASTPPTPAGAARSWWR